MRLPVERWFNAIDPRHSTRNYNGKAVEQEKLDVLHKLCQTFRPADGVRAELVTTPGEKVFRGVIGGYGKIKGNSAYVAFIGQPNVLHVEEMIGYLGEGIILEATALGLATCWIGGFYRRAVAEAELSIADGEQIFALSPLGYPLEKVTFDEKMMRGFKTQRKRKPLDKLVSGIAAEQWPNWVRTGLEAARLAPSAMNRQPWHFSVAEDSVTLDVTGKLNLGPSPRLDCGIAMLHFELGALTQNSSMTREVLHARHVARFSVSQAESAPKS